MPNDFDKIIRENLDALMPFIARKLLGLDLSRTETLKDKIQVTLEREGDHFKKVLHDGSGSEKRIKKRSLNTDPFFGVFGSERQRYFPVFKTNF